MFIFRFLEVGGSEGSGELKKNNLKNLDLVWQNLYLQNDYLEANQSQFNAHE